MSKNLFVGVDGKARKAKEFYVGVNGKARKIVKAYIGDENGKARPFWEKETNIAENSLEFVSDNSFTMSARKYWDGTISYNNGNGNGWTIWDGSQISSGEINGRQRIYFRGNRNENGRLTSGSKTNSWKITGSNVECNGNIECLLDYQKVAAGEHPEMGIKCYKYMFADCSALITAPQLPAPSTVEECYYGMFMNCSSLTTAPALPAASVGYGSYNSMFYGCSSLTTAPALHSIYINNYCYMYMFYGCSKLTTAPELPATTLDTDCYYGMFQGCSSLTTAPALPANYLAKGCYSYMFKNCSSLTTAPELPVATLADYCYSSMFSNCSSLTTAPKLPATKLTEQCYGYMFKGCSKLTTVPALPATKLTWACYYEMFLEAISISETQSEDYPTPYRIPTKGEGTKESNSLSNMFNITPNINTTYYLPKGISIIS